MSGADIRGIRGILDKIPRGSSPMYLWAALSIPSPTDVADGNDRTSIGEVGALITRDRLAKLAQEAGAKLSATDVDAFMAVGAIALSAAVNEIYGATIAVAEAYSRGVLNPHTMSAVRSITQAVDSLDGIHEAVEQPPDAGSRMGREIAAGTALVSTLLFDGETRAALFHLCTGVDRIIHAAESARIEAEEDDRKAQGGGGD